MALSQVMAQSETGKAAIDTMTRKASTGDIHSLIESLPNLENLWRDDPASYLEAVKIDLQALIKSGNTEAKNAALAALPNLIDKKSPADTAAATVYIRSKYTTIGSYFNLNEVRADKERLLMIANFLGEVRSLRIPNYQNQGTNLPGREILAKAGVREAAELPTQEERDAFAAAVKKNEEDMKMNELQGFLFSADSGLTFLLINYAKNFSVKDPANGPFYQEFANIAKLTEDEIKTLHAPK